MKDKYSNNEQHWFGKGCEWHICQFEYCDPEHSGTPVLTFCNLQQGGERDWEGNCSMKYCPMMWPGLRITSPNSECPICHKPLNIYNIARTDDSNDIRHDALGKVWCIECTKEHDSIDWDEINNN